MEELRKPYQGIWNIIRFNWHFYFLSALFLFFLMLFNNYVSGGWHILLRVISVLLLAATLCSLIVSWYVYDWSDLYKLNWLNSVEFNGLEKFINIHAGFDETSLLLQQKFAKAELAIFDFYDPKKHTEISIRRARKVYPSFPATKKVKTTELPLANDSIDVIFTILSAHEIRDPEERSAFFKELNRVLKPSGQVVVTEHLRGLPNFLAYNIGFFHFYSRNAWLRNFREAGFGIKKEISITPFIKTFILQKNGTAP